MGAPTAVGLQPLREILGLTGDQLAAHLHVNPRTVRSWEQGRDPVPAGVWDEMYALLRAADDAVRSAARDTREGRAPTRPDGVPDRWWRHVLARAYLETT